MFTRQFVQTCFVVPDLESAMQRWLATSDAGPFVVMSHVVPQNGLYRGRPAHLEMSCAFAQAGPMQIELIEQHSDGPSVYRDVYGPGEGGFHHLCYWAEGEIAAEVDYFRERGVETGYLGSFGPLNFGYFDARSQLGCYVEVLEREPGTAALFQSIADAAAGWDGSDPIRYV
jgi:hypothetical protein